MPTQITDNDKGMKRILAQLLALRGGSVTIGIHQSDAERKDDGPSNVLIGSVHEFGAPNHKPPIPARPFLRPGVKAAEPAINRVMVAGLQQILSGQESGRRVLAAMGEVALASVLRRINDGIKPALSPATILQRIRMTAKGRRITNAGARAQRSLAAGQGRAATWTRATFGKRADGSHGHIAGKWTVKGKGAGARQHKALAKLAEAMGGNFTPLVNTGQLRASLGFVVSMGGTA